MSIATEISRLQSAKASIKTAIEGKGVTVPSSTLLDGYAALISSIPTGGLPDWIKDGDTHLWLDIRSTYQKEQQLRLQMIGTINWGDGTAAESVSVTAFTTFTHTYAAPGKYRIDLHPTSGAFYIGGGSNSYNIMGSSANARYATTAALYQAEIGTTRITSLSPAAFYCCIGLLRIYIPKTITAIGGNMFYNNYSLRQVVCEDASTMTSKSMANLFYLCYNLVDASTFIPGRVTTMPMCRNCYSLVEMTVPATVTALDSYGFANCYSMRVIHCLPTTPPTAPATTTLANLSASCVIEVPSTSLATYKAAANWSAYASQMVGV